MIHGLATAGFVVVFGLLAATSAAGAADESLVVHSIDFTEPENGDAIPWLQEHGYELRLDAEAINPRFTDNGLALSTERNVAGLISREVSISGADRLRVVWGVERYPEGADWEGGVYRVPIAVMLSFGEKTISSGSLFVPDVPYFISLFLSRNAQPGKAYTAKYYKQGGRYFCDPCAPAPGETVVTEINLDDAFREQFEASEVPPITGLSIQMNTKDTAGGARSYLQRIEFLARK